MKKKTWMRKYHMTLRATRRKGGTDRRKRMKLKVGIRVKLAEVVESALRRGGRCYIRWSSGWRIRIWKMWWLWEPEFDGFWLCVYFWVKSTIEVWQALQLTMGSSTDKFMNGKGTGQMFGALWLFQEFSGIVVLPFSFLFSFFHYLSSFIFRFRRYADV